VIDKFSINKNLIKRESYDKGRIFAIDYFEQEKLTVTEYYDTEENLIETRIIYIPRSVIIHQY